MNVLASTASVFLSLAAPAGEKPASPRAEPPGRHTLHDRMLEAELVLIVRCSPYSPSPEEQLRLDLWSYSSLYSLKIEEVLVDRWPDKGRAALGLLSDMIPSLTAIGRTHEIPTDVDVLLFGTRDFRGYVRVLHNCTNSVVPLTGTLSEAPGNGGLRVSERGAIPD